MSGFEWCRVPVGLDPARWMTGGDCRTVLAVVHTVTSARRLLDVARLVETDSRIKVAFTVIPGASEAARLLGDLGVVLVPWRQIGRHAFHLAITAYQEAMHHVRAPSLVMAGGMGGGRPQGRSGEWTAVPAKAYERGSWPFGRDGRTMPAAVVFSHRAELVRLSRAHPAVIRLATVVGDSTYDRLFASLPLRDFYRRVLGVVPPQKLVFVTLDSHVGFRPHRDLLSRLLTELPAAEYRVLAWADPDGAPTEAYVGLADQLRNGLSLMPPESDWRVALVAADWIIGDRGSVAPYGAVTGVPMLLNEVTDEGFLAHPGVVELVKAAPRFSSRRPVLAQLREAAEKHRAARYRPLLERITSEPGRFNRNMRSVLYRLIRLRQPPTIPTTDPVAPPLHIEWPQRTDHGIRDR